MPHPSDNSYVQKMAKLWQKDHPPYIDKYSKYYPLPSYEMYQQWGDEQYWHYTNNYLEKT